MQKEKIIEVMNDPIAHELLDSSIPARMAYTGTDGAPRVIPTGFYWDGSRISVFTAPNAYKVKALAKNSKVALTIDTNTMPPHVLLVRGTASMQGIDGVPTEFLEIGRKGIDERQFQAWESGVRALYKQMVRISIEPEWAKILDFETRLPSAVEELVRNHD